MIGRKHQKEKTVKKIEAIIRHFKLDDLKETLVAEGIKGMTISEVRGFGRQRGHTETYRGAEYNTEFMPKVKVEIAVDDEDLNRIVSAVMRVARTGQVGDGKIFVTELSQCIRIRTGETRKDAV